MKTWLLPAIPLILCLVLHARFSRANPAADVADLAAGPGPRVEADGKRCLNCHGENGPVLKFANGESLDASVDPEAFKRSAHRSLGCRGCHFEFREGRHPNRFFRSRLQYQVKECGKCLGCHPEEAISPAGPHKDLFRRQKSGKPVICTDCHNSHSISPADGGQSEESYCLGCHSHAGEMTFGSKEAVATRVRIADLRRSPHKDLTCSDCHFGFSAEDHPRRLFGSKREYMVSSARICRRCHFDKYASWAESVHYRKIDAGGLNSATCIDCHGGHAVLLLGANRLASVFRCRACHAAVYRMYAGSVHGRALLGGNADVPVCVDCHSSHQIADPSSDAFHDAVPGICAKCHGNAAVMAATACPPAL